MSRQVFIWFVARRSESRQDFRNQRVAETLGEFRYREFRYQFEINHEHKSQPLDWRKQRRMWGALQQRIHQNEASSR